MKIVTIVPSWHYWSDPLKHQPYWELYYSTSLLSALPEGDIELEIFDFRDRNEPYDIAVKSVPSADLYFYWIFKSGDANELYSTCRLLRDRNPKAWHVAGGTHVDMRPEECSTHFDSIIVGPGEISLPTIVQSLQKSIKPHPIYQQKYTEVPFSDTPYPRRELLPSDRAVNRKIFSEYGSPLSTLVYFSRGCVYHCAYCVYNVPNMLQLRSPKMMRAELDYLKSAYGIEAVLLKDEVAIHPSKKHSDALCEVIKQAGLMWRGQTTSRATLDQLKLARESGCVELAVGVETVDDRVMRIIDKSWQSEQQIRDFIKNAKSVGIKVKMCLIFGLPGESADIVQKTKAFIEDTGPDYVSLSGFCPLPGSPIFREPEKYGIARIDHDWSRHSHLLFRYSDEEEVGLPFDYSSEGPFGPAFSRDQIAENIKEMQTWLNNRDMVY